METLALEQSFTLAEIASKTPSVQERRFVDTHSLVWSVALQLDDMQQATTLMKS